MSLTPSSQDFVGRSADLARVRGLIASGERLVTLVGQPGIGKTRLAREVVRGAPASAFCALAQAHDRDGICRAVAAGVGVSLPAIGSHVAQLGRLFVERSLSVLVLDNVEQILEPARELLMIWRDFAPGIAFVATSRERLRLDGEVVHELPALGQASRGGAPSEALELLLDRIARAGRSYGADELTDLTNIAARLEGLPLAIELVAPQIALLGARTASRRLAESSSLLSNATLRTTFEWSWSLLEDNERVALARCSVFVSGFTGAAAEALLGGDALALLASLRQKSLLVVSAPPIERLDFAFIVREFAAEKLDDLGLRASAELAHARFFAEWAERAEEDAGAPVTLSELALERENLIAAVERSLALGTVDAIGRALRAVTALHSLAWTHGPFDGYEPLVDRTLAVAERAGVESSHMAWALTARGRARRKLGRRDEAVGDLERSVEMAARLGDRRLEGRTLCRLGLSLVDARRFSSAETVLARALEITRASRDSVWEAEALYGLGSLVGERGDADAASGLFERAARLFDAAGVRAMFGHVLSHLAPSLLSRGLFDEAVRVVERALEVHRETGNRWFEALMTCVLGSVELTRGNDEEAMAWFDRGLPLLRAVEDERSYAIHVGQRALARAALGETREACADLAHAVDRVRGTGDVRSTVIWLSCLGAALAEIDDIDGSERSFAEAETLLGTTDAKAAALILPAEKVALDLAYARAAERRGDHALAAENVARARSRLASVDAVENGRSPERSFYYVKISFDRARRWLADVGEASRGAPILDGVITVEATGRWILTTDGTRHSLARKATMQRLLRRLLDERSAAPGSPVSSETLVAIGWPEERASHEAAMNRLRVTIARLRQLGLEGVLVGQRGGYFLNPDVPLKTG